MSTRYVWGKYNVSQSLSYLNSQTGQLNIYIWEIKIGTSVSMGSCFYTASNGVKLYWATLSGTQSSLAPSTNPTGWDGFDVIQVPSGRYYCGVYDSSDNTISGIITDGTSADEIYSALEEAANDGYDYISEDHLIYYSPNEITLFHPYDDEEYYFQTNDAMYWATVELSKGTISSYISSSSPSAYPSDGISGSYWYTYLTSGSIDPTAVALSSSAPVAGQSATIKVTPRSNSYGTISYLYQYSIDGGSTWTTIATSSATSYSFTVPTGATSIMVRVRAQDNLGFTSTDYVTSAAYTVTQSTTYAGVSGVVRSVTDYAGVSGAVRSVTTYKGVGGAVRS